MGRCPPHREGIPVIRTFPNPTAAEQYAKDNPPELPEGDQLRKIVVEQFGAAGYALRLDITRETKAGRIPFCRYIQTVE